MTFEIINTVILSLTLITVAAYTVITRRLHLTSQAQLRELVRQRQLSVIPALLPFIRWVWGEDKFEITNIGHGIALNIQIKDVAYSTTAPDQNFYRFEIVHFLRPDVTKELKWKVFSLGVEANPSGGLPHFKQPPINETNVTVAISFQDILGTQYDQVLQMGRDGTKQISLKPMDNEAPT